jgi:hypothetical protein
MERKLRFILITVVLLAAGWVAYSYGDAQGEGSAHQSISTFAEGLILESSDLRRGFYDDLSNFDRLETNGLVLLVPNGSMEDAIEFKTNECNTVADALTKYAPDFRDRRQIRLIQKNAIFQTPKPRKGNENSRKNFLKTILNAGDVVVVTKVE